MQRSAEVRVVAVVAPGSRLGTVETWGLAQLGLPELEARRVRRFLLPHAAAALDRLARYLAELDRMARPGETVSFGGGSVVRLARGRSESGRDAPTLVLRDVREAVPSLARIDHRLDAVRARDPPA